MIEEIKIFTEEREDFLYNDVKNYLNKYWAYDYEIQFSTTPLIANGSSTKILYSVLIIIKKNERNKDA